MNMNGFKVNVALDLNQVDQILAKLYDGVYREVADLVVVIRSQVEKQIAEAQAAASQPEQQAAPAETPAQ